MGGEYYGICLRSSLTLTVGFSYAFLLAIGLNMATPVLVLALTLLGTLITLDFRKKTHLWMTCCYASIHSSNGVLLSLGVSPIMISTVFLWLAVAGVYSAIVPFQVGLLVSIGVGLLLFASMMSDELILQRMTAWPIGTIVIGLLWCTSAVLLGISIAIN